MVNLMDELRRVVDAISSRPSTIDISLWTWLVCEYWYNEKQKLNNLKLLQMLQDLLQEFSMTYPPTQELDRSSEPHEPQQDPLYISVFEKKKKY
ncbi:Uridine nucleosidase [Bienertia sinuspersici]